MTEKLIEVLTVRGPCGHSWTATRGQVIAGTWQTCPTCELERLAAAERERAAAAAKALA